MATKLNEERAAAENVTSQNGQVCRERLVQPMAAAGSSVSPARMARILSMPWADKLHRFKHLYFRLKGAIYYRHVFASFGKGSSIHAPMMICNPRFMHIGNNVLIREGARLEAVVLDPAKPPELWIGDNVNIEQDVHIVVMGKVIIHENVSITARCSLLCGTHPFFDIHDPVKIGDRLGGGNAVIEIGAGSFLGVGSMVQMNVRIGRHVVVGSNAVVKRNVPDYSVVDGNPAKVVLYYDHDLDHWVSPPSKD